MLSSLAIHPPPPITTTTYNIPTFLLSATVLLYLSTFVVFAVLRVITGISIQRVGYLSLKRISLDPRDDVKLEIRKLGLLLHRPTFAQPTWVSLVVQDSHVTLDLRKKDVVTDNSDVNKTGGRGEGGIRRGSWMKPTSTDSSGGSDGNGDGDSGRKGNKVVEGVRRLKENLKKVHKWIKWICLVDIVVTNTTVTITDVGSIQIGSLTMMVDTRRGTANRNPMFDHCTDVREGQWPIEWIFAIKSVLILTDKKEPTELLDHGMCNVYGVVEEGMAGIRDLAIAFKFGRVTLPCDELLNYAERLKGIRKKANKRAPKRGGMGISLGSVMEEMAIPGSRAQRMTEVIMESKELLHSILRGVKEIQYAIGYLVISKELSDIQPAGRPLQISLGMKEFGMDVHQLDQKSPAHRMYSHPNYTLVSC